MADPDFVPLSDIDPQQIIDLMNDQDVGRHLPLLTKRFSAADCAAFLRAKQALWDRHGFGPRAILIGGDFAGWGGLQPEQGEADFALVLHPRFWGWGRRIFDKVRQEAFGPLNRASITALLPPGRSNGAAILRLGFREDGRVTLGGETFLRFRLSAGTDPA